MKKSGKDRLKSTIYGSTLSTAARSPFPNGEGCETRIPLFSTQRLSQWGRQRGSGFAPKGSQPRLAALGGPFQGKGLAWTSLLPMEGGAPKGRRLDGGSGIPDTKPSPRGEGKEEAASPQKKESQPRLAALGSPFQGKGLACTTPSFLWKEVPRRGGGWMGILLSPTQSLPRVGKVASGASRIGY